VGALGLVRKQPGLLRVLSVLIGSQGLISACNSATQQLVVLRLLEMLTGGVSAVTGVGFGLAGIASSFAAVGYTRVTRRLGYVRTAAAASGMVALAVILISVSPWAALVVVAIGLNGLFSGVVIPAGASMIGLETPHDAQSTVFGFNASSIALGFFIGPLIGGSVAATAGVRSALLVIAGLALVLSALISTGAREPSR
jgi:DHA1 family multidrug resistance protein-like MFS transporter